jgi:DCC1-like thiol-disulfide oxidoreductase
VSKRDRRGYFRFVPIQLAEGRPLAEQLGINPDRPGSFAFVATGQAYVKSEAALRIARAWATMPGARPHYPASEPECQCAELFVPTDEEGVGADHKRSGPQLRKTREHNIEVAFCTRAKDFELEPERTSSRLSLFDRNLRQVRTGWLEEQGRS